MPDDRGIATLLAFADGLHATAQDDVLDILDVLLTDLLARVGEPGEETAPKHHR